MIYNLIEIIYSQYLENNSSFVHLKVESSPLPQTVVSESYKSKHPETLNEGPP